MIKQYFTDGLIQLAIILSLLRTDVHNYFNGNFIQYPEIQDIILGTSAAYTQTNFHNLINNIDGEYSHPKNIENDYFSSIFNDIQSLYRFHSFDAINHDINAFLVDTDQAPVSQTLATSENQPSIAQEAILPANGVNDSQELDVAVVNDVPVLPEGAVSLEPASDPTFEDLDLIEVLWRQDIDLGVGKEAFDISLRRELEREREVELQKQREKQRQLELLRVKAEDERRQHAQQWLQQNFIQDGETGEWSPVNSNVTTLTNDTEDLSFVEALRILDSVADTGASTIDDLNDYMDMLIGDQASAVPLIPEQALPHVDSYNEQLSVPNLTVNTYNDFEEIQVQQTEPYTPPPPQLEFGRQSSFEQSWNDLVNVLALPPSNEPADICITPVSSPEVLIQNATMPSAFPTEITPFSHSPEALIQNATMPSAFPTEITPFTSEFLRPSPTVVNMTMSSLGSDPVCEWESSPDLFANMTSALNETNINTMDDMLTDLLPDGDFDEMSLEDMEMSQGLDTICLGDMNDDAISVDSAISSMDNSLSPTQHDLLESPYDGIEGATGGSDLPTDVGKYDPKYYNSYTDSKRPRYHSQFSNSSSNDSSSSSTTIPAKPQQINHNHTYPLGCEDSSLKIGKTAAIKLERERNKERTPVSKDDKRIKECDIPMTMSQIVDLPVEEFTSLLSMYHLSPHQLQVIRDIRRRGKNKVAAQNCRQRKVNVIDNLETGLGDLQHERDKLMLERREIDKTTRDMKESFNRLYEEVFRSLRDERGRPYNPNEYSLQQTSDGDIFLVPRNATSSSRDYSAPPYSRDRKRKYGKE